MREAAIAEDRGEYARLNQQFHRTIVAASGNKILLQVWDSLSFEVRVRRTLARQGGDWPARALWHGKVVDAIEAGDAETAGRLLEEHARSFIEPSFSGKINSS